MGRRWRSVAWLVGMGLAVAPVVGAPPGGALGAPIVNVGVVGGPFATGDLVTLTVSLQGGDADAVRVRFRVRLDGAYAPAPPVGSWATATPDPGFAGTCDPAARPDVTFDQEITCDGVVAGIGVGAGAIGTVTITARARLSSCAPEAFTAQLIWQWGDPATPDVLSEPVRYVPVVPLRPTERCAFRVDKAPAEPTVGADGRVTWVIGLVNEGDPYWLRNDGRTMVAVLDSFDAETFDRVELEAAAPDWTCSPEGEPYEGGGRPPFDVLPPGLAVQCGADMGVEFFLDTGSVVEFRYRARVVTRTGDCLPDATATNRAFAATGDLYGFPELRVPLLPDIRLWESAEASVRIPGTDDAPGCTSAGDPPAGDPGPAEQGTAGDVRPVSTAGVGTLARTGPTDGLGGSMILGVLLCGVGAGMVAGARRRMRHSHQGV